MSTDSSNNQKSHYSIDFRCEISFGPNEPDIILADFALNDEDNNLSKLVKENAEIMKATNTSIGLMITKMDDIVNSMKSATFGIK